MFATTMMRCRALVWFAVLAPDLLAATAFAQVTVPVYVPGYRDENWDGLAGSVLSSVHIMFSP